MPSLHNIEIEIANILAVAEELDEDQQPAALEYLDQLALMEVEKVDGISFVVRKRANEIDWLKDEEARLRQRRQAMESRLIQFKAYLRDIMTQQGLQKIKGNKASIFLRQSESVEIDHAAELPEKFVNIRIESVPDKAKIKEAIKSGSTVPGASLVQKLSAVIR